MKMDTVRARIEPEIKTYDSAKDMFKDLGL